MHLVLLISSVLLAVAVGYLFTLLRRLRDWRAGFVIAWLPATMLLLVMAIRGEVVSASFGLASRSGELKQLAITGLAIAAVIYFHVVFQRDALTGLPNRTLLVHRLGRALARLKRRRSSAFAVLFLDLDRFKVINDSLGHGCADQLLVVTAERLRTCVQSGDTIARLGGDEFVILLRGLNERDAILTAGRLHRQVARPLTLNGQEVFTTVSIGIAVSSRAHAGPEVLLQEAHLAMYRAKTLGRSRYEVFNASMHRHAAERLTLESELRRAAERGQFTLHYQPVVSLAEGRLVGLEALLRWQHAKRGMLLPMKFISMAEEIDLIIPIGLWVLEQACRQMHAWQQVFPATRGALIHVNLSGRQFVQSDLVKQIDAILGHTGLAPQSLGLEITETVMMDDAEMTSTILSQLRSLDVKLLIDDFGIGYSSLSYLNRLPIDILKIDRSFVTGMWANGQDAKIVRSIIALARDLELGIIAEGIESAEQVRLLRSLGCGFGQGNYLCAAADGASLKPLLSRGRVARWPGSDRVPTSDRAVARTPPQH